MTGSLAEELVWAFLAVLPIAAHFVKPETMEHSEAEAKVGSFDFSRLAAVEGRQARAILCEFNSYVAELPEDRRGSAKSWIKHILTKLHPVLLAAFDRERALAEHAGPASAMDMASFVELVGRACSSEKARSLEAAGTAGRPGLHAATGGQPPPPEEERKPCKECNNVHCPKARRADGECDVHGDPTEWRIARIPPFAREGMNRRRVKAGKEPLKFPSVSAHTAGEEEPPAEGEGASAETAAVAAAKAKADAIYEQFRAKGMQSRSHTFSHQEVFAAARGVTCAMCDEQMEKLTALTGK